jgi:hypothetical protein
LRYEKKPTIAFVAPNGSKKVVKKKSIIRTEQILTASVDRLKGFGMMYRDKVCDLSHKRAAKVKNRDTAVISV